MFFIGHINILTLFYKFVTFYANLLLFDQGVYHFLKYSAGHEFNVLLGGDVESGMTELNRALLSSLHFQSKPTLALPAMTCV